MIRSQVGVDHGRLDVSVSHQFHHGWQVDTLHHQVVGKGMTKGVESGQAFNTSLLPGRNGLLI